MKRLGIEEGIELNPPLFDLFLKNDAMHDPMVNDSYCETFGWVNKENLARMKELTYKANDVLKKLFDDAGLILVDFKLEFGLFKGEVVLVAFDSLASDKADLERLFRLLTTRIAFLTAGDHRHFLLHLNR